jgi:glutamyl-tRNA reductase
MSLAVIGVSHHTAPVEIRERFAFSASEVGHALACLRSDGDVREAVLLSTCNRTEIYLFPAAEPVNLSAPERILLGKAGLRGSEASSHLFRIRGHAVVRHLFEVTSGLDSMVTGEAEIQGQVKEAYETASGVALEPPIVGPVLNRLFQTALSVGGRVRHETGIGEGSASVASVAVELARKIFGTLRGKRVLILGAGTTGELTVEALAREGVRGVIVANRTYDRAVQLSGRLDGRAVRFDQLEDALRESDIVVSSTAAPHVMLTREMVRSAFPDGPRRPLLIVDIALPRDVEPSVGDEPNVFLYNVDDLRKIVDEHVGVRRAAVPHARRIVNAGTEDFRSWYASLEVVPVIRTLREQAEVVRAEETSKLLRKLAHLPEEDRARVEAFTRSLLGKLLHDPTSRLRRSADEETREHLVEEVRSLFGLPGSEDRREDSSTRTGEGGDGE